MPALSILIPTYNRPAALAVTLAGLAAQNWRDFELVVSDQGEPAAETAGEVQTVLRLLRARGHRVSLHRHLPRRGMAEQRAFLLAQAQAPLALFLDDDVLLEPDLLSRLFAAIDDERCGFVGCGLIGLSYLHDERPHQQAIEFWDGPVHPEVVRPDSAAWARHHLHSAANLWHAQRRLGITAARQRKYKVAWIGGCVLYDVAKLQAVGGFDFWRELPTAHCGEEVLAQLRLLARYGGCGIIPSGAYHQELPTTVPDRRCDAPFVLPLETGSRAGTRENT
jgi:glycosyltransferase involved in cell wall biosynthesis